MATVTPPSIATLPSAPDPNNRATFNALAYPWSAALPAFGTQIGAVATNVKSNADVAANSATDATTQSGAAAASAGTAVASAATAVTNAATSTTAVGTVVAARDQTIAQASLAVSAAASAASVLQQDLSAFTGALHRSPNAVTAQFIYDTSSKDSDGGAWVERMQDKSWFNEPLNGAWRGQCATEAACRAISGAATGDYFQLTTDGKFYKLSVSSGTTEVFRGNTAKFPRLSAIIAEASSVTIYDLTAPARPMWMRFTGNNWGGGGTFFGTAYAGVSATSVSMLNGVLLIGTNDTVATVGGLSYAIFTKDTFGKIGTNSYSGQGSGIVNRRNAVGYALNTIPFDYPVAIVNATVNSVAMTVLPDAPIDVATGLAVPTIAVATAGGVSVLKHDGTVVNSSITTGVQTVVIQPNNDLSYGFFPGAAYGWRTIALAGIAAGFNGDNLGPLTLNSVSTTALGLLVAGWGQGPFVNLVRMNRATTAKSVVAFITNLYNTGWMVGDIRRCYLASVVAGSLGSDLAANGAFSTDTAWTKEAGWTISGGVLVATGAASGTGAHQLPLVALNAGTSYAITFTVVSISSGSFFTSFFNGNNGPLRTTTGTYTEILKASSAGEIGIASGATTTGTIDNISVKECDSDRSVKGSALTTYGTITKTPVATGSQLVAYSGFSSTNYLQEPYSADLDFGTGEWSVSAWVNYTSAAIGFLFSRQAGSGTLISAYVSSGQITCLVYDGATYRSVTTTATYNTGTWLKVRFNYTADGALRMLVNGVPVASTSGTPLLTLNNGAATLTVGNRFAIDSPFPGSIALLKISATVPTAEQALFAYAQEAAMFKDGAQVCLPDGGAVRDLSYDGQQDKWVALSPVSESSFTGLVRTATYARLSGAEEFSKSSAQSGIKLLARTAGADVSLPAYGLREELLRRGEAAAKSAKLGANTFLAAQDYATGTAVASAATINLDAATGNRVHITGTTAITAITLTRGPRTVIFDGVLTLTHNATTNNLPGAANITTAVGDRAIYESDGTTVYCVSYIKVSGSSVVTSGAGDHFVAVYTGNGTGSSSTAIRRFTTVLASAGTDVTYADSATLGGVFTIVGAGLYAIQYQEISPDFGITRNAGNLTVAPSALNAVNRLVNMFGSNTRVECVVTIARLSAGDLIRAQTGTPSNTSDLNYFSIRKVGV